MVIDVKSAYNGIFDRPIIHALKAILSTLHQELKYLTFSGVGIVRGEKKTFRACYVVAFKGSVICIISKKADLKETHAILDRPMPVEELELVVPLLTLKSSQTTKTRYVGNIKLKSKRRT